MELLRERAATEETPVPLVARLATSLSRVRWSSLPPWLGRSGTILATPGAEPLGKPEVATSIAPSRSLGGGSCGAAEGGSRGSDGAHTETDAEEGATEAGSPTGGATGGAIGGADGGNDGVVQLCGEEATRGNIDEACPKFPEGFVKSSADGCTWAAESSEKAEDSELVRKGFPGLLFAENTAGMVLGTTRVGTAGVGSMSELELKVASPEAAAISAAAFSSNKPKDGTGRSEAGGASWLLAAKEIEEADEWDPCGPLTTSASKLS